MNEVYDLRERERECVLCSALLLLLLLLLPVPWPAACVWTVENDAGSAFLLEITYSLPFPSSSSSRT